MVDIHENIKLLAHFLPQDLFGGYQFFYWDRKRIDDFLSDETVCNLLRVDETPFRTPLDHDKIRIALFAMQQNQLYKKLFRFPYRFAMKQYDPVYKSLEMRREIFKNLEEDFNVLTDVTNQPVPYKCP